MAMKGTFPGPVYLLTTLHNLYCIAEEEKKIYIRIWFKEYDWSVWLLGWLCMIAWIVSYFGLSGSDSLDGEAAFGVVQETEVLVGLFEGDDVCLNVNKGRWKRVWCYYP